MTSKDTNAGAKEVNSKNISKGVDPNHVNHSKGRDPNEQAFSSQPTAEFMKPLKKDSKDQVEIIQIIEKYNKESYSTQS